MMVIPGIDVHGGKAVRLLRGDAHRMTVYADDPARVAAGFAAQGAPRVHLVDLDAALGTGENGATIRRAAAAAGVPVQVGGGLRSPSSVEQILDAGADRAVLGTEAIVDPSFLETCLSRFEDRIVVAVDTDGERVRVRGWTEEAGVLEEVVARLEAAGVPRFLVTAVGRDGTLEGPDVALYRRVLAMTGRPVIASGGVSGLDDLRALRTVGVEAVVVGKALYEERFSLQEAASAAARDATETGR